MLRRTSCKTNRFATTKTSHKNHFIAKRKSPFIGTTELQMPIKAKFLENTGIIFMAFRKFRQRGFESTCPANWDEQSLEMKDLWDSIGERVYLGAWRPFGNQRDVISGHVPASKLEASDASDERFLQGLRAKHWVSK